MNSSAHMNQEIWSDGVVRWHVDLRRRTSIIDAIVCAGNDDVLDIGNINMDSIAKEHVSQADIIVLLFSE